MGTGLGQTLKFCPTIFLWFLPNENSLDKLKWFIINRLAPLSRRPHMLQTIALPIHITHDNTSYSIRPATPADIPFLATVQYEASLPPANFSFWDYPLMGLGVDTHEFIQTVMRLNVGAWGNVAQFWVMEHDGQAIAGAAGIEPDEAFARGPVRISAIPQIGKAMGWSGETIALFQEQWPDPHGNFLLLPQAPWIIESVAVMPAMRGKGLLTPLMNVLFEEGKRRGHSSVGITVANGNNRAQRGYERLGFQMYLAFGTAFFGQEGFNGYTKYKRPLDVSAHSASAYTVN
jgi:GNAT superfamily N-acetyltransferase